MNVPGGEAAKVGNQHAVASRLISFSYLSALLDANKPGAEALLRSALSQAEKAMAAREIARASLNLANYLHLRTSTRLKQVFCSRRPPPPPTRPPMTTLECCAASLRSCFARTPFLSWKSSSSRRMRAGSAQTCSSPGAPPISAPVTS